MSDRDRSAADARRLLCPTEAFMLVPPAETTLRCAAAKREIELPWGRTVFAQCAGVPGMTVGDSTEPRRDQLARLARWREADCDAAPSGASTSARVSNGSALSVGGSPRD